MPRVVPLKAVVRIALLAVACIAVGTTRFRAATPPEPTPTRALWVTRTTLTSPESISQMVRAAEAGGFNTLLVQVRARGDAYFDSSLEPRAAELASRPAFDPLATTIEQARAVGLKVHAWVSVNLVSSAYELPPSRQHIVYRAPEWLMVPRELAAEMRGIPVRSPAYVGRLARWTRAHAAEVEGLYVSPASPAAAIHTAAVIGDLVQKYTLDGVHLDYVRFPSDAFDYGPAALDQFKLEIQSTVSAPERSAAVARERLDPLAYPNLFPNRWESFRRSRLTALVMRVRTAVKAARPDIVVSAAVVPDAQLAFDQRLQDWRTWLDESLVDVLCPMAYTSDATVFQQQVAAAKAYAGDRPVWAGIGAYRLSSAQTLEHIAAAQRLGTAGIILFSYDALIAPPNTIGSLSALGRAAFERVALTSVAAGRPTSHMALSGLDYAVIGVYLLAITAFGSWFARYQKTTRDYFLTDRSVPWWAICFTIVATETSTLTFIGIPATAYGGNMTFLQLALGYIFGRLLVSVLFIPAYFRGELFTSYELLQRRFGTRVKTLAAMIFLATRSLADGIRLFTTALVISIVTDVPVTWVVIILGSAMILYTMRGGVSAVIWTDVVQMFVYLAGAAAVALALFNQIPGGWDEIVRVGRETSRFTVLDLSFDLSRAYTLWAGVFGGIALTLATHGTDQYLVQRLLSAQNARGASRGLILSGFIVFAQFTLFLLIGVMLYVFYQHTPVPAALTRNDQILPLFVVSHVPHGLAGFIVAAIIAAALSPSLNAMAATTVSDFYLPYVNPAADQATQMRVSKMATVAWGIVQLGVAVGAQFMERSVLDAGLAVLSFASGSVLGAFLIGTLASRIDEASVFWGMAAGLAVMTAVWWGTTVAFTWYVLIGATTTCAVAFVLSRLTRAATMTAR